MSTDYEQAIERLGKLKLADGEWSLDTKCANGVSIAYQAQIRWGKPETSRCVLTIGTNALDVACGVIDKYRNAMERGALTPGELTLVTPMISVKYEDCIDPAATSAPAGSFPIVYGHGLPYDTENAKNVFVLDVRAEIRNGAWLSMPNRDECLAWLDAHIDVVKGFFNVLTPRQAAEEMFQDWREVRANRRSFAASCMPAEPAPGRPVSP